MESPFKNFTPSILHKLVLPFLEIFTIFKTIFSTDDIDTDLLQQNFVKEMIIQILETNFSCQKYTVPLNLKSMLKIT